MSPWVSSKLVDFRGGKRYAFNQTLDRSISEWQILPKRSYWYWNWWNMQVQEPKKCLGTYFSNGLFLHNDETHRMPWKQLCNHFEFECSGTYSWEKQNHSTRGFVKWTLVCQFTQSLKPSQHHRQIFLFLLCIQISEHLMCCSKGQHHL